MCSSPRWRSIDITIPAFECSLWRRNSVKIHSFAAFELYFFSFLICTLPIHVYCIRPLIWTSIFTGDLYSQSMEVSFQLMFHQWFLVFSLPRPAVTYVTVEVERVCRSAGGSSALNLNLLLLHDGAILSATI